MRSKVQTEGRKAAIARYTMARRAWMHELRLQYGAVCVECGECLTYALSEDGVICSNLEFHHLDPSTKRANVGSLGKASAVAEATLCVLLCTDCHKGQHGGR